MVFLDDGEGALSPASLVLLSASFLPSLFDRRCACSAAPQDLPIVVEYSIADFGHIKYYLAPKIEDDEMAAGGDPTEAQS